MKGVKLTAEERKKIEFLQKKKNSELLKKFILDKTEAKVQDKLSDESLDKELVKRKLLKTIDDLWTIKNIEGNILRDPKERETIFHQEFYKEIFRLNNWHYEGSISQKPWQVGRFTNEIIYYRFSAEVLPFLKIVNPYIIPGKRKFKHHQWLTPGAREKLSVFISEAVELMKKCEGWNEFRIKYCKMYNVPYQLKMFNSNLFK